MSLEQGIQAIKTARKFAQAKEYEQARKHYVEGLGILHKVRQAQRDPKKAALLKANIDLYLKEAENNKKLAEQKNTYVAPNPPPPPARKIEVFPFPKQNNFIKPSQSPPKVPAPLTKNVQVLPKPQKQNGKIGNLDAEIKQLILKDSPVSFGDIVGMKETKKIIIEAIVLPKKRPDIFSGIRAPPRGILFYGPPGNGKTFLAKAIAHESGCTFFNISASALVSKYMGDSEKTLRKVFQAAYQCSPSIIFIDQIDSILTNRSESEQEGSRRLKTQFLIQLDGMNTSDSDEVVVIGATNLPKELDKAALRRFPKKIYVGMPDYPARLDMLQKSVQSIDNSLKAADLEEIAKLLDSYSASDIKAVIREAVNRPLREVQNVIQTIQKDKIRKVNKNDFKEVLKQFTPSVSKQDLKLYAALQ